jgi:hypothetical protein
MMFAHDALTDVERGTEVTFTYKSNRSGNEITRTGVKTADGHVDVDPENAEVYTIESSGRVEKSRKVGELVEIEVHEGDDDDDTTDDADPLAAFDEPDEVEEGMELTEDGERVYLIKAINGDEATVQIWNGNRRGRRERMSVEGIQNDYDDGTLQVV